MPPPTVAVLPSRRPVGGVVTRAALVVAEPDIHPSAVVVREGPQGTPGEKGDAGTQGPAGSVGPVSVIVCAEPIPFPGLPVYVDLASRQLRAARADTYRAAFVAGLATAETAVGFAAPVSCGQVVVADWTPIIGATDLTPGIVYFLAPQGGLTPVPPLGLPGVSIVTVGRAADARTLFVAPSNPILQ